MRRPGGVANAAEAPGARARPWACLRLCAAGVEEEERPLACMALDFGYIEFMGARVRVRARTHA